MAYTPTVYTNDASSPDLDATNLNKSEQGIKLAHDIAVPVDCSSRVAEYTGDGGGATVKDRAGNGNNLTATDITYVNGKYGKEMSFNGSTSFAQASSPVIGTTGTVAIRFKRETSGVNHNLLHNNIGATNGLVIRVTSSNYLIALIGGVTYYIFTGITTTGFYSLVMTVNGSQIKAFINSVEKDFTQTEPMTVSTGLMTLGRSSPGTVGWEYFFNGIISHFRHDSRIWTADEARAWSLNPISIDSRV